MCPGDGVPQGGAHAPQVFNSVYGRCIEQFRQQVGHHDDLLCGCSPLDGTLVSCANCLFVDDLAVRSASRLCRELPVLVATKTAALDEVLVSVGMRQNTSKAESVYQPFGVGAHNMLRELSSERKHNAFARYLGPNPSWTGSFAYEK